MQNYAYIIHVNSKRKNRNMPRVKLLEFDVETNSGHIYPSTLVDPILKEIYKHEVLLGMVIPNNYSHEYICLSLVSHAIKKVLYDKKRNCLMGDVEILDTPMGKVVKECERTGVIAELFPLCVGSFDPITKEVKEEGFKFITFVFMNLVYK